MRYRGGDPLCVHGPRSACRIAWHWKFLQTWLSTVPLGPRAMQFLSYRSVLNASPVPACVTLHLIVGNFGELRCAQLSGSNHFLSSSSSVFFWFFLLLCKYLPNQT